MSAVAVGSPVSFWLNEARSCQGLTSLVTVLPKDNLTAYWHYRKTKGFQININEDTSVMYIGKATKAIAEPD